MLRAEQKFKKYFGVLKNQIKSQNQPNKKEQKQEFKIISHPVMNERGSSQDDIMSQELVRLWNTGENILKAVEDENIMELTNILLNELVHTFELIFSPNIGAPGEDEEISYIMAGMQLNTHLVEVSNNATLLNILITDLAPVLDLSKTQMDEEILAPDLLNCVVDQENQNLKSLGYKIGTHPMDYYKGAFTNHMATHGGFAK